jgi:DNA-directed RNA polymerase III subunit RPC6
LAGLSPPEEVTGGVWYNANQGYDTALVQAICSVLLKRTHDLTFPKISDRDEEAGKAPIHAFAKARLPSPHTLLNFIKDKRLTTAQLTVKNVMECMRALELDGKVETIKPMSMSHFDIGDDEPGPSKRRKMTDDGDSSSEDDSRKEKEKQKAKERAKEKKRRAREKEKKEKEKKEKEKKKRKKEKEKEKEREKKRRKKKEKEKVCPIR